MTITKKHVLLVLALFAGLTLACQGGEATDGSGGAEVSSAEEVTREGGDEAGRPSAEMVDRVMSSMVDRSLGQASFASVEMSPDRPGWEDLSETERDQLREFRLRYMYYLSSLAEAKRQGVDPSGLSQGELRQYGGFSLPANPYTGETMNLRSEEFSPGDGHLRLLTEDEWIAFKQGSTGGVAETALHCDFTAGLLKIYGEDETILKRVVTVGISPDERECHQAERANFQQ